MCEYIHRARETLRVGTKEREIRKRISNHGWLEKWLLWMQMNFDEHTKVCASPITMDV